MDISVLMVTSVNGEVLLILFLQILNKEGQWQAVTEAFQKREVITENAKKVMDSLK